MEVLQPETVYAFFLSLLPGAVFVSASLHFGFFGSSVVWRWVSSWAR